MHTRNQPLEASAARLLPADTLTDSGDRARLWRQALEVALALAVILLLAVPTLVYPLAPDHGVFAVAAKGILNGQLPYVDFWEVKPPAVYYVYALALALFGESVTALRLFDLIVMGLTFISLYLLGARLAGPRVGLWALLILAALYYRQAFWVPFENDAIAMLPMTLAALFAVRAGDARPGSREALWYALGAGAFGAAAFWFKYPFALVSVALAAAHLIRRYPVRRQAIGAEAAAFALGNVLVLGGVVVWLHFAGILDDMIETARVTVTYTTLAYDLGEFMRTMKEPILSQLSLLNMGWVLLLVARWPFSGEDKPGHGRRWAVIWLWLLAGAAIMLTQAKGYAYHWQPMLPPLALLAAESVDVLLARFTRWLSSRRATAVYRLAALVAAAGFIAFTASTTWDDTWRYLTGRETQLDYYSRLWTGPALAADSLRVADYVRERTPSDASLYIFGFRPEVYFMSGMMPPTRFMFLTPVVGSWYPRAWRDELLQALEENPPAYVLVTRNDPLGQITGRDEDSYTLLQEFTRLYDWLGENYVQETEIGDFLVWRDIRLAVTSYMPPSGRHG